MRDSLSMMNLRSIFYGGSYNGGSTRLNDHQMLEQLATRLVAGQVRILELPLDMPAWGAVEPRVGEEEAAPMTAAPAEPVEPIEEPVPPAAIAQAATLKQAAISGTPFCEP